jgi:hypothetical protein
MVDERPGSAESRFLGRRHGAVHTAEIDAAPFLGMTDLRFVRNPIDRRTFSLGSPERRSSKATFDGFRAPRYPDT